MYFGRFCFTVCTSLRNAGAVLVRVRFADAGAVLVRVSILGCGCAGAVTFFGYF